MHRSLFLSGLAALAAVPGISARLVDSFPPATRVPLEQRQASGTTAVAPATTISEDPWQCVTENITQYFVDVPTPTGKVLDELDSFGYEVAAPCRATATSLDRLSCTVSDPKSWCGFTTAAPPDVLSSYSTYLSSVVSFWTAKSESIEILSTSCPVAWARPHMGRQHEWLKIARAHAECFLDDHPQTGTSKDEPTGTDADEPAATTDNSIESTPTEDMAIPGHGMAVGSLTLISMALAVVANIA